jgi:hypothetical protein
MVQRERELLARGEREREREREREGGSSARNTDKHRSGAERARYSIRIIRRIVLSGTDVRQCSLILFPVFSHWVQSYILNNQCRTSPF